MVGKWLSSDIMEMVKGEREELRRGDKEDRWGSEKEKEKKWRNERRKEMRVDEVLRRMKGE